MMIEVVVMMKMMNMQVTDVIWSHYKKTNSYIYKDYKKQ